MTLDGEATWAEALAEALEAPDVPAQAKPTTAPPPAQLEPAKTQPAPAGEPAKKPTKGAAALKASIAKPEPAKLASDPREEEPGWMAGGTKETPEPVASNPPPEGMIEVACSGCDMLMDTLPDAPKPWLCYACRQA